MRPRWALLLTLLAVALGAWLLAGLLLPEDGPTVEIGPAQDNRPQRRHRGQRSTQPRPVPKEEPRAEPEPDDALAWGARLFDDAIRYVSRGGTPVSQIRSLILDLNVVTKFDTGMLRGRQRTWIAPPDRIRLEFQTGTRLDARILNGESAWYLAPGGRVDDVGQREDAEAFLTETRGNRGRVLRFARLVTLQSWKGPGVTFRFAGYTKGTGAWEGNWIKIRRHAPTGPDLTFWLAWERGAGNDVRATWPGIVRIEGDPLDEGTVDYILRDWGDEQRGASRAHRYPRRIAAYVLQPDETGGKIPHRYLEAGVTDLQLNVAVDAALFEAPR